MRAIAEAHGGRLRYRTTPDGGALFEMVLARTAPSAAADSL
ncbi:ATP-binding protein [Pannonibacter sp. Pt2-lr]